MIPKADSVWTHSPGPVLICSVGNEMSADVGQRQPEGQMLHIQLLSPAGQT